MEEKGEEKWRSEMRERREGERRGRREGLLGGIQISNPAQQFCGAPTTRVPQNFFSNFFDFVGKYLLFEITFFPFGIWRI